MKTIKMNRVLIALDYNPTAQKVAELGFSMAKAMNERLLVVCRFLMSASFFTLKMEYMLAFN